MSILWRLHLNYLLHRKTQIFFLVFLGFNIVIFAALSRFYDPLYDRVVYQELFILDYFMETFSFIKLSVLVVIIYLVIQLFILSPSDIVLLQRVPHGVLMVSKVCVVVGITGFFASLLFIYQGAIGFATHRMLSAFFTPRLFLYMAVFIVFYSLLLICVALAFNHMFAVFSVLLGYFASEMLIDFDISLEQIGALGYAVNVLFMNIHILNHETIGVIYPYRIIIYTLFCYLFLMTILHKNQTY